MGGRICRLLALIIASTLAVVACGSSQTPTASGPSSSTTAPSQAASGQPTGTLVVSIAGDPHVFNTNYVFDNYAYYTDRNIYSKLVDTDYSTGKVFGDLALSWSNSPDLLTYTFKLREGVKWDDGQPFSSADVVWTYSDVIGAGTKAYTYSYVSNIASVTAPDANTVVFTLNKPQASFVINLANYYAPVILAKHLYAGTDVLNNAVNQHPIGTGPFTFVSQSIGNQLVLQANPYYYGLKPTYDKLVFRVIPDRATSIAALSAGEVGYSTASPAFGDESTLEATSGIKVAKTVSNIIQWSAFNLSSPILKNLQVRQALAHATNTPQLNDQVYNGLGTPSTGEYLSYSPFYDPTALQPAFDVAAANQLLDAAGYPLKADGVRFSLNYLAWNASIYGGPELAQVLKQQWQAVGIDLNVVVNDFAQFNALVIQKRDWDVTGSGGVWGPDPQTMVQFVGTKGGRNVMGYSNPQVDSLLAEASSSGDANVQKSDYTQVQQLIAQDLPRLDLVEYVYLRPYRSSLSGFWWEGGSGDRGIGQDMYNGVTGVTP